MAPPWRPLLDSTPSFKRRFRDVNASLPEVLSASALSLPPAVQQPCPRCEELGPSDVSCAQLRPGAGRYERHVLAVSCKRPDRTLCPARSGGERQWRARGGPRRPGVGSYRIVENEDQSSRQQQSLSCVDNCPDQDPMPGSQLRTFIAPSPSESASSWIPRVLEPDLPEPDTAGAGRLSGELIEDLR